MKEIVILSVRGSIIGDSIRDAALMANFKERFPSSKIIYSGTPQIQELFKNSEIINYFIEIKDFSELSGTKPKINKLFYLFRGYISLRSELKKFHNCDIGVITSKNRINQLLLKLLFLELNTSKIIYKDNINYLKSFFNLKFGLMEEKKLKVKFRNILCDPYVYIQGDASSESKALTLTYLNKLIKFMEAKKLNVVLGGMTLFDKKLKNNSNNLFNLINATSLRESGFLMKNSYFSITNDSGLAHLGASVDSNLIILSKDKNLRLHHSKQKRIKILLNPSLNKLLTAIDDMMVKLK